MSPLDFDTLHRALQAFREQGCAGGGALATLLRTRGPVFRRAGARMLVLGDGRIVRGLSAGCPEADIANRAQDVIATGTARLLQYDREHGYDALLELGCGGEMEILLEPLAHAADLKYLDAIADCLRARQDTLLFTAFARDGRCLPRPLRALWNGGVVFDEFPDPAALAALLALAPNGTAQNRPVVIDHLLCATTLQVMIEPLRPALALTLIGANSTSLALARLARALGWPVQIVVHDEQAPSPALPTDIRCVHAQPDQLIARAGLDAWTAVVVMTHNLERDLAYVRVLQQQTLAYLGALGSRQRAARMRDAIGTSAAPLHVPAGLDIGSETPEEIALAIASEIQATVSGHAGGPLSRGDGPIH